MFALSFGKLVVLAAVVVIAWYGYRWWQRVQRVMRDEAANLARHQARSTAIGEDMVKCPVCDTYLSPRGARSCGREACPYPG